MIFVSWSIIGLVVARIEPDPAKRGKFGIECTTTGPEHRLLDKKGAVMFAWYMTDVVAFVLGLFIWLWVLARKGA